MKANESNIKKRRQNTEAFKKEIMECFERGKYSVYQLERLHGISNQSIYQWIYKFSTFNDKGYRVIEHQMSSSKKVKELEAKVRNLEQAVGKKQITIDYLEKMIELAKDECQIDIKKKILHPTINWFRENKEKVKYSISSLYDTFGISKQAIHQYAKRQKVFDSKVAQLVIEVDELRTYHPGCGVEKMYRTLNPSFMGKDRFIELVMSLGYRLKRSRNFHITTRSGSHYYNNLIEGLSISSPCNVWQSDINYIRVNDCFYYAVFIINVYTRKIVGYQVSDHMRASANILALRWLSKTTNILNSSFRQR
ncbi:MAG: transposase-like protein [Cyclobacteriaceae bacterium]|jgi:transposase-like protein